MDLEFLLSIEKKIKSKGLTITNKDFDRPWGGFLVIDESQIQKFIDTFFDKISENLIKIEGRLSPKILIVKPHSRLSWQYHKRRAEIWQIISGKVGVARSFTDTENEIKFHCKGEQIFLQKGERHRLIGLDEYGVVAELWQHSDIIPSDEDDIIRIQDDFGR